LVGPNPKQSLRVFVFLRAAKADFLIALQEFQEISRNFLANELNID